MTVDLLLLFAAFGLEPIVQTWAAIAHLARTAWYRLYDPCALCPRPARRGGFLLCRRCFALATARDL